MFWAFIMHAGGDIDHIKGFDTEEKADEFGKEWTAYHELDPMDDPDHWQKYDPPVVLLFEGDETALETGKYTRPTAVYMRGEKYILNKVT